VTEAANWGHQHVWGRKKKNSANDIIAARPGGEENRMSKKAKAHSRAGETKRWGISAAGTPITVAGSHYRRMKRRNVFTPPQKKSEHHRSTERPTLLSTRAFLAAKRGKQTTQKKGGGKIREEGIRSVLSKGKRSKEFC